MIYVVHCKREKRSVYIGRPSVLGNPYPLKKGEPRGSTLDRYRKYLQKKIADNDPDIVGELNRLADIAEDGDLYLGCWCTPNPCHGDVIREELYKLLEARKMSKKPNFILIIAGSRGFDNYKLLEYKCDKILSSLVDTYNVIIRSGGAKGADKLGERYAKKRGYTIQEFIPNWRPNGVYDNSAGHKRNRQMADGDNRYPAPANGLIAFSLNNSPGTQGMIDYATKKGVQVRTIHVENYDGIEKIKRKPKSINEVSVNAIPFFKKGGYDALCVTTNGNIKKDGTLVMGRGIAKDVADAYPGIARQLAMHVKKNGNIPAVVESADGYIISFPTKHNWRDDSDIDLIVESMRELIDIMDEMKIKSVLLPRPGVSNGHLSWETVYKAIEPYVDERITFVSKKN